MRGRGREKKIAEKVVNEGAEIWEWLGEKKKIRCAEIGFDRYIGLLILAFYYILGYHFKIMYYIDCGNA